MSQGSVTVENLTKSFKFAVKDGSKNWLQNLTKPEIKKIIAVDNISFEIKKGETVAFIGPNGAGKSTTIKMLTGILQPSSGQINISGFDPSTERKKLAYKISTVFGQRSQLFPNLSLTDSLEFFGVMYDLSKSKTAIRIEELSKLFDLKEFINQPVRKLSLGQRMRAEVAAALIHKPEIILLDEPTIGLDVVAKKSLRDLLVKLNQEEEITIFLTSHDTGDIESLCKRTIIINNGSIIKDLPTTEVAKSFANEKYIDLIATKEFKSFPKLPENINYVLQTSTKITLWIDSNKISTQKALLKLLEIFPVEDINVYNVDLEKIIRDIYEKS
jgi:ABC-2 type transport system ATP-binding protein